MFAVRRAAVLPARVMRVCGVPRAAGASVARMSDDTYDKRRQGLEKQFFNKQDERKLRELLAKMREQVVEADPHASAGSEAAEKSHLMEIVGKYGMAKEDIAALIEWKHEHHH